MIRPVQPEDVPFLKQMIYEGTIHEAIYPPERRPSLEAALVDPGVARFVEGWGRPGDFGVVAIDDGQSVGAAWCRLFGNDDPAWIIDEKTPDMAIAIVPGQRGRGWGGKLIDELLKMVRREGFEAMSLNVGKWNRPAIALYERHGFSVVDDNDDTLLMRADLQQGLG